MPCAQPSPPVRSPDYTRVDPTLEFHCAEDRAAIRVPLCWRGEPRCALLGCSSFPRRRPPPKARQSPRSPDRGEPFHLRKGAARLMWRTAVSPPDRETPRVRSAAVHLRPWRSSRRPSMTDCAQVVCAPDRRSGRHLNPARGLAACADRIFDVRLPESFRVIPAGPKGCSSPRRAGGGRSRSGYGRRGECHALRAGLRPEPLRSKSHGAPPPEPAYLAADGAEAQVSAALLGSARPKSS